MERQKPHLISVDQLERNQDITRVATAKNKKKDRELMIETYKQIAVSGATVITGLEGLSVLANGVERNDLGQIVIGAQLLLLTGFLGRKSIDISQNKIEIEQELKNLNRF